MFTPEETAIAIADAIYARRCDEHVCVSKDCPKRHGEATRSIPPYCGDLKHGVMVFVHGES